MSSVSGVASNYLTSANWTDGSSRTTSKTLDQNDFLTLVVTEMTNQDPLNPTSNTEYIAEMAQFSSLEQSKSMQKDIATLQANSLIGREVEVKEEDDSTTRGTVGSVLMDNGTPQLEINGNLYDMDALLSIKPATTTTTTTNS